MFLRRRNREQRENVLGELVLTEREYGRDLKLTWQVVTLVTGKIVIMTVDMMYMLAFQNFVNQHNGDDMEQITIGSNFPVALLQ